jgi:hypothetical protein
MTFNFQATVSDPAPSSEEVELLMPKPNNIIITVRAIKVFESKNISHVVIRDLDLQFSLSYLTDLIRLQFKDKLRLKNFDFDSYKVYFRQFQAKSPNLVVNCSTPEEDSKFIFPADSTCSLLEAGFEDQCEVSVFRLADYEAYRNGHQGDFNNFIR